MSKKLALIASQGTLDHGYPPFILASTAGSMGWEVGVFFTFYGLVLLKQQLDVKVAPIGNPAMPIRSPIGSAKLQSLDIPIPTLMMAMPGFNTLATAAMNKTFENKGVASLQQLRSVCEELENVQLIACQMTMDVFGFAKDEFINTCEVAGAAAFLDFASDADVTLFV